MDERACSLHRERVDGKVEINTNRLNNHSDRIDAIERDIVAQKKDTTHLQEAIKSLQVSIEKLVDVVEELKSKPLDRYDKIAMIIVSGVIGYLVSMWFR